MKRISRHPFLRVTFALTLALGCTCAYADNYVIVADDNYGQRHYLGMDGVTNPQGYYKPKDYLYFSPELIWSLEKFSTGESLSFALGQSGILIKNFDSKIARLSSAYTGGFIQIVGTRTTDTSWETDDDNRLISRYGGSAGKYACYYIEDDIEYGHWGGVSSTQFSNSVYPVHCIPVITNSILPDLSYMPSGLAEGDAFAIPSVSMCKVAPNYIIENKNFYSTDNGQTCYETFPESSFFNDATETCDVTYTIEGPGLAYVTNDISTGTVTVSSEPGSETEFTVKFFCTPANSAYPPFTISRTVQIYTSRPSVPVIRISGDGNVTITQGAGATPSGIYYSVDESEPTTSSTLYTGTFTVSSGTTVKAIAVRNGDVSIVAEEKFVSTDYVFVYVDDSGHRHYLASNANSWTYNPGGELCFIAQDKTIIDNSCVWSCRDYSSDNPFGSPVSLTSYSSFNFVQHVGERDVFLSKHSNQSYPYVYFRQTDPTMTTWYAEHGKLRYNTNNYTGYLTYGANDATYGRWRSSPSLPDISVYPVQKTGGQDFGFTASLSSASISYGGTSVTVESSSTGIFQPDYYQYNGKYYYSTDGTYDTESVTAPVLSVSTFEEDIRLEGAGAHYVSVSGNTITCISAPDYDVFVTVVASSCPTGYSNAEKTVYMRLLIEGYMYQAPSINADMEGNVEISSAGEVYYTIDGTDPTSSSTKYTSRLTDIPAGTTVKAVSYRAGVTSAIATATTICTSGISGSTVILDDLEDHTWTYYQGVDPSIDGGYYNTNYLNDIYSPNPRNVKIRYSGNGGCVSIDETQNEFIYYETLEAGETDGRYDYQVISNPFSKRPAYSGFAGWKIVSGGEYILYHDDGDIMMLDEKIAFVNLPYPSVNCLSASVCFEAQWTTDINRIDLTAKGNQTISFTGGDYETNFVVMKVSSSGTLTTDSPCTIMMVEPDGSADYRGSYTFSGTLSPNNDGTTKIEYANWQSSKEICANIHDLYIGRGLPTGSTCAGSLSGTGTSCTNPRFRLRVESGLYDSMYFFKAVSNVSGNQANANVVIGCDYDRATGNNDNLIFTGQVWPSQNVHYDSSNSQNQHTYDFTIKSGKITPRMFIETAGPDDGIKYASHNYNFYIGSLGNGWIGRRNILIEGGEMCTVCGGGSIANVGTKTLNFRMKGGTVHGSVYGGASEATITADICMCFTGGNVLGWIAAGCNGTSDQGGKTAGKSHVYVGGDCHVDSHGSEQVIGAASVGGHVYGAGSGRSDSRTCGEMTYGTNMVIADNAFIERNIFAGGNYGYSAADSRIYVTGGNVNGGVYGGANRQDGKGVDIFMTGGSVMKGIFGGSNVRGTMDGNVNVRISGGTVGTSSVPANVHGGGYGASTAVTGDICVVVGVEPEGDDTANKEDINNLTIYGDVYGGSALGYTSVTPVVTSIGEISGSSPTNKSASVKMYSGTVNGNVYGGALGSADGAATIGAISQTVDIYGGRVTGGVFGGSNINASMTAATLPRQGVTVHDTWTPTADGEYAIGSVFGGGNGETAADEGQPGAHDSHADGTFVTVLGGSVGSVFGGGNAATALKTTVSVNGGTVGNIYGGSNKADINGSTSITVNGTVSGDATSTSVISGIYGGCNTQGNVSGTTSVSVLGGTIGKADALANIHGGGFGQVTTTGSDVSVSIGSLTDGHGSVSGPLVYADIYGGSALGSVNSASASTLQTTSVSINSGSVYGNVYGGGLGQQASGDAQAIAAVVNGNTQVDVYAAHFGPASEIFGGNNLNGSPVGNTTVHVHETAAPSYIDHITENQQTFPGEREDNPWDQYAIKGVYGGSNKALFHTADAPGETNVIIDDCSSSIAYVYGGSNAADVYGSTSVTVNGAGKIGVVFGGGNGSGAGNPGANVLKGTDDTEGTTGNTVTNICGGTVDFVFGGSNTLGDVEGAATVNLEDHNLCDYRLGEVYGAGNAAPMTGTPYLNIGCIPGVDNIYGGARNADLSSDVTLDIHSGTYDKVFGGNNLGGTLLGSITVNIEETGCSPINIGELYGCGNMAAYTTPAGKTQPKVNIISATSIGKVYGGGLGESATVTGSPTVSINMVPGTVSGDAQPLGTIGSVFGGGNAAVTVGNTTINLATASGDAPITGNVYGGGNLAAVSGDATIYAAGGSAAKIFGGGNGDAANSKAADITGNTSVLLTGTAISAGLYGGCNAMGTVGGNTSLSLTGGSVGTESQPSEGIFGGGYGQQTAVSGNVDVTLNGTPVYGDVYGGSALGSVNSDADDYTHVTLTSGSVSGNIYGGGLGQQASGDATPAIAALVNGDVLVTVDGGTIVGSVFGCNNMNGSPVAGRTVTVDINSTGTGTIDAVYGGGNLADSQVAPHVNINSCDVNIGSVYGGGNAASTTGANTVIWGGTIGSAFGGGNGTVSAADVSGDASLTIHGGTIASVYAGSNTRGLISGSMMLDIDQQPKEGFEQCPQNIGEVYGGGNKAEGKGAVITIGCGSGYLGNVYGGAKAAKINGDLVLDIRGGQIDNVFGGNNESGEITGSVTVNIDIADCPTAKIRNVYGGGNIAPYSAPAGRPGYPKVNLISGTIGWTDADGHLITTYSDGNGNVFGGGLGEEAVVTGNPVVNLVGYTSAGASDPNGVTRQSTVLGSIYGGGDLAAVSGDATVNLTKGTTAYAFGGGNKAVVNGNTRVTLNGTASSDATVTHDLYGGGSLAAVNGNTHVELISGTVGGNVYGGGLGQLASADATPAIPAIAADVNGSTTVELNGANVTVNNVFGCNNLNGAPSTGASVTVTAGTVTGNVYGGGNLAAASVSPAVSVSGGSIAGIFGGGLGETAVVTGSPTVNFSTGRVTSVFGGGDMADLIGSPQLSISGGESAKVFGGGNKALVTGNPNVSITGGTHGTVFGGGNAANVIGTPTVTVTGSDTRITGNVFGGGNQGDVSGSPVVTVGGATM